MCGRRRGDGVWWWRSWFGFVGRDGEREGEKRRGLPAPSYKLSRGLMVDEDAHWCGGSAALSLLGGVSSSGRLWTLTLRAAGLPAGGSSALPGLSWRATGEEREARSEV